MDNYEKISWSSLVDIINIGESDSIIDNKDVFNNDDNWNINDGIIIKKSYKRTFDEMNSNQIDIDKINDIDLKSRCNKKLKLN
jgi:hypothetical protein